MYIAVRVVSGIIAFTARKSLLPGRKHKEMLAAAKMTQEPHAVFYALH